MIQFLANNWIQLAIAGVALLVINAGPLLSMLGGIKLPSLPTSKVAAPTRRKVLDDLDDAFAYFQSVNCTEGMNAISTAAQHAWAQHPTPETGAKA